MYQKEIRIKDWDFDDYGEGRIILDWIPVELWDGVIPAYRFFYKIEERFIEKN